jgi:hypothetical protein
VQVVLPTTQLDCPSELGQLIGAMEHCAISTKPSFLEELTIPSLSLKAAPDIVQQYLREAAGFTALATAQRHVRSLYETVLNPARYTIEHNHNLNRAQDSRTESDAKSMATACARCASSTERPPPTATRAARLSSQKRPAMIPMDFTTA